MPTAIVPGTFDPVTNGHLDIISRAAGMFDTVQVAVVANLSKKPVFSAEERIALLAESCSDLPNVTIASFSGLLVDYVRQCGAKVIVRGLRAVTDFEYELQMAHINRRLCPEAETVFMMTATEYSYLSSSIVKEIALLGGPVEGLVPENVRQRLTERLNRG